MNFLVIGYTFSDSMIKGLTKKGFKFLNHASLHPSYKSHRIPFTNGYLEIREVIDEASYCQWSGLKVLNAEFQDLGSDVIQAVEHKNTAFRIADVINSQHPNYSKIQPHLKVVKDSHIKAVHLNCQAYSQFLEIYKPDIVFELDGRPACFIQLNPACFDLLVTEH